MTTVPSVIAATQYWLKHIVIGENFCPFAKREFERQSIRYKVVSEQSSADFNQIMCEEFALLDNDTDIETTLLIFEGKPAALQYDIKQFDDFMLLVEDANWQLGRLGYDGIYQLATFHPDYLFADESVNSASHYTNRSPFPMLHIIRESSIDRAFKTYKDPESIPVINVERASQLGSDYFKAALNQALKANSKSVND